MADHSNEILSDNTQINYCNQCKNCIHWGNNKTDYRSNKYDKVYCDEYPYPNSKPRYIVWNQGDCIYREEK